MTFTDKIIIPEGNKKHLFDISEVKFIKADRYYVNVFCFNKKVLIRITMKKLQELLPDIFIRISKSVIVNVRHIVRIEESKSSCCIVLAGEIEQQVSEKYRLEFDNFFSKIA
ncbi:LytR/AlgR family response regulator transcription factor [Maribacter aurantiacus]|uniref:LytTR family transcriptional regulator n=1 Tax=Maribacter aurantiacus TaxID=1882343 RepID=A0A5R8M6V5_9FLAO|nr:LytTR family DNA-binding domain-containing protein [Maribacter aurantiacus]TLF45277.1 LytTR family transcriptional regulator [Maribacter aurantiacus]